MNTILKNTISITVITLVAGLALGVVQDITAGPIATQEPKNPKKKHIKLFLKMLPVSVNIHSMTPMRPKILLLTLMINGFTAQTIDEIMVAEDASGETLGYAFTVTRFRRLRWRYPVCNGCSK